MRCTTGDSDSWTYCPDGAECTGLLPGSETCTTSWGVQHQGNMAIVSCGWRSQIEYTDPDQEDFDNRSSVSRVVAWY